MIVRGRKIYTYVAHRQMDRETSENIDRLIERWIVR